MVDKKITSSMSRAVLKLKLTGSMGHRSAGHRHRTGQIQTDCHATERSGSIGTRVHLELTIRH